MKRISSSSINYIELYKRVPIEHINNYKAFREKSWRYIKNVNQYSATELPKIDWYYYEDKINPINLDALMEMKHKYNTFKVPYPIDVYTKQIELQEICIRAEIKDFLEKSNCRIIEYEKLFEKHTTMMPFKEMTMEDYADAFPDIAPDFIKRPSFWPHTPDEQISPNEAKIEKRKKTENLLAADQLINTPESLSNISC